MSWDEFLAWAQEQIDAYNNRPHSSFPKIRDPETYELRHPTPNEIWNGFVARGVEIEPVDQAALDDARRRYEWRVVNRGTVAVLGGRYFHQRLDAEGWHGRRVMVGYDLHATDRVWVRAEDGRLICIAQLNGNQIDYMPKSLIERAVENRLASKIKNAERKAEELRFERDGEKPQIGFRVIDGDLSAEDEAAVSLQLASLEAPALPAPANAPGDGERPHFLTEEAWVDWVKAGHGDDDDRAEFARRCQSSAFCMLYDIPLPEESTGEEAELRAAG